MKPKICVFLCILNITSIYGLSYISDAKSLVLTPRTKRSDAEKESISNGTSIYGMNIHSIVSNRFAKTNITSKVRNAANIAQETQFAVVIPDEAFISSFVMEIGGKKYEAYVQEKEQAKKTYDNAKASGQAAGHVAVSARDSNRFTVEVNVEPESKVIFYLTYEQLLQRTNNKYEIVINIQPGQTVEDLVAQVDINESRKLTFVDTPALRSANEIARKENEDLKPEAQIDRINETFATVKFNPSIDAQKKFAYSMKTEPDNGLNGQFVVQYDVERDPQGGEVLVDEGYFVHFFAPSNLKPLPKNVVFVLDTSGSMYGHRITQLKEAMDQILEELASEDVFSIIDFSWTARIWNITNATVQYETNTNRFSYDYNRKTSNNEIMPTPFEATKENIDNAKRVVQQFVADGGTDINKGLELALKVINSFKDNHQPLIIFLTDGEPTVGVTSLDSIISGISGENNGNTPIFAISLGDGADREFLKKLALKNNGFSKHIYEGADVAIQLEDFYKEISSPLLSNITFKYTDSANVSNVTKDKFGVLFQGKEVVVAGKRDSTFEPPMVDVWGLDGPKSFTPKVERAVSSLERLWAYLTLQQLLDERAVTENKNISEKALALALKYSFVSDVTSLVVVKPNASSSVDLEDGSKQKGEHQFYAPLSFSSSIPSNKGGPNIFGGSPQYALASAYPGSSQYSLHSVNRAQMLPRPIHALITRPMPTYALITRPMPTYVPMSYGSYPSTTMKLSPLDKLKMELPWLDSILNTNGTINIQGGAYGLGLDQPDVEGEPCQNSPEVSPKAYCRYLDDCSEVYHVIRSVEQYEKHFCIRNGYAGVCCPNLLLG